MAEFAETYIRIPEGKDAGKPLKLRGFQHEWLEAIYGTPTRTAIISVARKNAKSAFAAILLLGHLAGPEARLNSQLYSTALSRDQAAVVFGLASKMVRMSPDLSEIITVRDSAKELTCSLTGCTYKALSADACTAHGRSPVFLIHDELGQIRGPHSELFETMESGTGAHDSPLSIIISTQAPTDADLLSMLIDDAKTGADPLTKLIVYEAQKDCDLDDEAAWKAANPALGDFLNIASIRKAAGDAMRLPSRESSFRNLNLNQRVAADGAFLSADAWKLNAGEPDLSAFEDHPSWWGLDLSARLDLTALVGICRSPDGVIHVDARLFAPREGAKAREDRDRAPYTTWARQGILTLTEGRSVDYGVVAVQLGDIMARGPVQAVAFDRWRIDQFKLELDRHGIEAPLVPFGQGYRDMSPAIEALEVEALAGKLRHGGHPIMTWCAANAVVTMDPAGSRKLDKSKATGRIDGLVALAMAVGSMANGAAGDAPLPPSPWEQAGFSIGTI